MDNTVIMVIIIVALVLLGGIFLLYNMQNPSGLPAYTPTPTSTPQNQNQTKGTIYFAVTDAAANMQNVSAINMTIDRVDVYSAAQGWVTITQAPQTFSLLELKSKNQSKLLAKASVFADTFSQVKLHISKVMVTESGKVKEAKLPSNNFNLASTMKVNGNSNSTVTFDFLADQSLHTTEKGEFIFAPVVSFESRSNATVDVDSANTVVTSYGTVDASNTFGMDLNGEVKLNFKIDPNLKLNIGTGGVIQIDTLLK